MFSSRLDPDLSPGRLQQALDQARAGGAALIDLTCSNPPQCGLGPEAEVLAAALAAPGTAEYYPDPRGMPGARGAVARYYADRGLPTEPDDIFLSASTSQSYAELIKLFADPGDEILVPQPSYPLFDMLVTLEGCRPVRFASSFTTDGHWRVDVQALERAVTSRTRAVILVSPNNPTGAYLAPEQYAAIRRLCSDRSCPILLDEVFHDYPAHGLRASSLDEASGLTVRLSGLSKVVGAPQLKLGWIRLRGDDALVRAAAARLEFIADVYLSASTPAQLAAESLLPARGPIQARILERLATNQRAAGQAFVSDSRARLLPREGGWYLVVRLSDGEDEEELAYQLLVQDHVIVHPGFFYDFPQGEHLVLSLIPPPDEFAQGVSRIEKRIAARARGGRARESGKAVVP
jgi:aspartate/methionine/tyrosine aminotransferase